MNSLHALNEEVSLVYVMMFPKKKITKQESCRKDLIKLKRRSFLICFTFKD